MTADRNSFTDWPRLLGDLQYLLGDPATDGSGGHTPIGIATLAKYLGWSRSQLMNVMDGTKVEWHQGEDLIALWSKLSGKPRQYVPITVRSFSANAMNRKRPWKAKAEA